MQKLLSIAALSAIIALSSCKDDENGPPQLSKAEATAEITQFNTTAKQDLQALANAQGVAALADLSSLTSASDPFGGRATTDKKKLKTFFRKKGLQFRSIFSEENSAGRSKGIEPFDFNAKKGIYEWNAVDQIFVKTGSSTIVQIKFPTEGSTTNNAELKLKAYEEVEIYDIEWQELSYEPTLIQAELHVASTKVASLDLTMEWDESGFPLTGDLSVSVNEFTATVAFDISSSTKNTLSASLSRSNETLFATSIAVLYSDADKSEASLKSIEGFVQVKNLKLQGTINIEGMDMVQDEIDLNDFIKLKLYSNDKKLGDIVFVTEMVDGFEESVAYLKYADGSKEKLETILQPVIDEFEALEADLNG